MEFEHAIAHTLGPLGQRTATQAQGLGTLQWLAYGSGHVHGLLLDGQPLVDWERDALHREVGRTLHVLEGQGNEDLPAIVHARQLDPMGRMLHQDWRGLRHAAAMPTTDNANDSDTGPSYAARRIAPALGPLRTIAQRRYQYDALGQLVGVQTPGEATRYGYDAWQRLTAMHRAGPEGELHEHWVLDAAGNRLPSFGGAQAAIPHASRQPEAWAREVRENLHDAGFDLLRANGGPGESSGTVTHWPGNRIGWSTVQRADSHQKDALIRYQYDAFGNRVQVLHPDGRIQRLHYDALHQLREVCQREQLGGAWRLIASYRYDALGRRLSKTVYDQLDHGGTTTYAGWDGDRLIHTEGAKGFFHTLYEPGSFVPLLRLERSKAIPTAMQVLLALDSTEDDDSDAPALGRNFFAALPRAQRDLLEGVLHSAIGTCAEASLANLSSNLPLDVRVLLANGLDEIRGRRTTFARAEDTCIRHILCDHLGTPIAMVDANGRHSGLLTWAATYHSWGALREEYNPNDISQPIRFQGQQFDAETGLHYNRLRYYDPSLGQYLTQDPIGLLGGNDKYIYPVSPTGWIDPTGLNPLAACAVPGPTMAACAVAAEKAMSLLALGTAALATAMIPSSTSQMSDAERLSSAHEAAMGNSTAPGYGGNCSPEEHDALRDKKEKACDDAKGLSCQKGELNYGKAEKIQKCIDARINIARKCFAGGDAGHNEQINQLFRIIGKCTGHNAR